MITFYTDKRHLNGEKLIENVDEYFDGYIILNVMDKSDNRELQAIDGAMLTDSPGIIKTKFGVADYYHISTGCKAALLCKKLNDPNVVVSLLECGVNAVEYILSNFDNIKVYSNGYRGIACEEKLLMNGKEQFDWDNLTKYWK